MALQPLWASAIFYQFPAVGRTPSTGISPSQGRYPHTGQHKHNKRTQTSMPRVGLEPTIPAFERTKTFRVLHRAATVIDSYKVPKYNLKVR
jgi:hypothetical protein